MDFRELKAFCVVAQELNFRKAADLLGMSQPPLSRLISNLEADLGVRLFHRSTRNVELTGEGLYLFNRSKTLLEQLGNLEGEVKKLKKVNQQTIKIALHHAALHSEIPKLLSSFKLQFPGAKIQFVETKTNQIEKKLLMGELDLAIGVISPKHEDIETQEVNTQELGLLISKDNFLSSKSEVKLRDLEGETLIFHGKDDHLGFQGDFAAFLKKKKIDVKIYYKKSTESCPDLTARDKGILVTSKNMAIKTDPRLIFVPFSDFSPKLKVIALWRKDSPGAQLNALLSFLKENRQAPPSDMDYHFN